MSSDRKRKAPSYSPDHVDYVAFSRMEEETFAFIWSLKNLSRLPTTEMIVSPKFEGGLKSNGSWQLSVWPKKEVVVNEATNAVRDYFSVNLRYQPHVSTTVRSFHSHFPKVDAKWQVCLLDSDDQPQKQTGIPKEYSEFTTSKGRGYPNLVTYDELHDPSKRLVVDDTVRIHCRIWIKCELEHKVDSVKNKSKSELVTVEKNTFRRIKKLSLDFKGLLETSDFADVTLVTLTQNLQAHKLILIARSPVFRAMFQSSMIEAAENLVNIPDFEADVVEGMLEYMYTGEVTALSGKASDLLRIADKYELVGLKEDCEEILEESLNIETAAETLVLAHLYTASQLKSKVLSYISRNKERVSQTKGFKELIQTNQSLLTELFLHK